MPDLDDVLSNLRAKARPDQIAGMARYGINPERRLGVAVPAMRKIAREAGRDHRLALALWRTGIPDARILASMVDVPEKVTQQQMERWVRGFDSWDVCDQVCMNLFEKTPFAWHKAAEWSRRDEEFVKRAAFALIACLAWHDQQAADEQFVQLLPVIRGGATDERPLVKKAVSWALRNIGKRNPSLHRIALDAAREMGQLESRSARWIASDAVRDLTSAAVQRRLRRTKRGVR